MSEAFRNNTALQRFELDADGHTAVANYRLAPGAITFTHTEVDPALRGCGIGSRLVARALEAARAQGLKVAVQCAFVADYIRRHPGSVDQP